MPESGEIILNGRYRIEGSIGRGAFGDVYLAVHLQLDAPRAIKVLSRSRLGTGSAGHETCRERFALEARLGSIIDHPNVVRVYDLEEAEGESYLVMEYAPGGSLKDLLERQARLEIDNVVWMALDLCDGLTGICEQAQVVHRDIKPSNILFDANGRAKIADLGLAQVPGGGSLRSLGSLAGAHPGTPEYMSPEQELTKGFLLPTSDVFSLGCTLFEALTGKLYKLVYGTHVRDHRPDVPQWLDDIVARALSELPGRTPADDARPDRRYRAAALLRDELYRQWQAELLRRGREDRRRRFGQRLTLQAKRVGAIAQGAVHVGRRVARTVGRLGIAAIASLRRLVETAGAALSLLWQWCATIVRRGAHSGKVRASVVVLLVVAVLVWDPAQLRTSVANAVVVLAQSTEVALQSAYRQLEQRLSPTPAPDAMVASSEASLRSGPGDEYMVLASYAHDSVAVVLGRDADGAWLRVNMPDGRVGWMNAQRDLQVNRSLSEVPLQPIPTTPGASTTPSPTATASPTASPSPSPSPFPSRTASVTPSPTSSPIPLVERTIFEDSFVDNRNDWSGPGSRCGEGFWLGEGGYYADLREADVGCAASPSKAVQLPPDAQGFVYEVDLTLMSVDDPRKEVFMSPGGFREGSYMVGLRGDGTGLIWRFIRDNTCVLSSRWTQSEFRPETRLSIKVRCDPQCIELWVNGRRFLHQQHSQLDEAYGNTFSCTESCRDVALSAPRGSYIVYHRVRLAVLEDD